jgi:vancomycin resistance protein YoaR
MATLVEGPSRMNRSHPSARSVALTALLLTAPVATAGEPPLSDPDRFPVVLGSFSTTLIGSLPERTQNVRLAARALDALELAPGEVLSFNQRVGARTLESGYLPAPVILHEVRQVQNGGGVCQVSSTLFVAGLLAGLTPVERWRHTTPVDYIALGEDATISWGAKDLRMRNDFEQAVRVRADVLGSTLTVRIEGESELSDRFDLETVEREATPGTPAGGREIELYRVKRRGDETLERELVHRDRYPPWQGSTPERGGR